jgi:hypothetical protein
LDYTIKPKPYASVYDGAVGICREAVENCDDEAVEKCDGGAAG